MTFNANAAAWGATDANNSYRLLAYTARITNHKNILNAAAEAKTKAAEADAKAAKAAEAAAEAVDEAKVLAFRLANALVDTKVAAKANMAALALADTMVDLPYNRLGSILKRLNGDGPRDILSGPPDTKLSDDANDKEFLADYISAEAKIAVAVAAESAVEAAEAAWAADVAVANAAINAAMCGYNAAGVAKAAYDAGVAAKAILDATNEAAEAAAKAAGDAEAAAKAADEAADEAYWMAANEAAEAADDDYWMEEAF